MPQLSLLLQQSHRSRLDSSFQSLEKITPVSFFSFENPVLFSLILLGVILSVVFIFYRYVIIPMRKKHLQEQENLKLQQAELMALFTELAPDPIFRFDEKGKIVLANNSAHRIFPHKALLGENVNNILPFITEINIEDIITTGGTINETAILKDRHFQFLVAGVPRFSFCQVYGRDITDLIKTQSDLKSALVRAEESKKLKEFFLSQISHEVRSPLNAIIGYSDLILQDFQHMDPELEESLRSIINNSKRIYRTFDLLLNMSQLQTGKYETRFEKVDILSILKTLQREYHSISTENNTELSIINNAPEHAVNADHYSITQVFSNLIDNAIKFTKNGNINITIYRDANSILCVDIADTGIGIPEDYQRKLFTTFSQADMSYQKPYEGTGLGLALVKSFIDLNMAKIKCDSAPGKGSTFTVIFSGDKKWSYQKQQNQKY